MLPLQSAPLFCSTLWPAGGTGEAGSCQVAAGKMAAASQRCAREKNSAPRGSLWWHICCGSSKGGRTCQPRGKLADHNPSTAAGSQDGAGQGQTSPSPLAEGGLGEWSWGKSSFCPLSPGSSFHLLLDTWFHLSADKIDADLPQALLFK